MKRVLLVDDEPAVLDALCNVLRRDRARLEVLRAEGGERAIEVLRSGQVDILVTDMRMSGMSGLELLEYTREHHPDVVRLSLSGFAEDEVVVRASAAAHQQLGKPCEPGALRAALANASALHDLLSNVSLRQLIGALGQIPTSPGTYATLSRAMSDPNVEFSRLARIIERDLGASARILKLVNSAFFGAKRHIGNLQEAILRLGLGMVRHVMLSLEVRAIFPQLPDELGDTLEHHALLCARVARRLVAPAQAELAVAGGLLHDIGRLALAARIPREYAAVLAAAKAEGAPLSVVERRMLGADHAEVGGYLLGLWGQPAELVHAAAHHHDRAALPPDGSTNLSVVDAVRVAELVTGAVQGSSAESAADPATDPPPEGGGSTDRLPLWRAIAGEEVASQAAA